MTNAIQFSGLNESDIWNVVKKIKLEISLDKKCGEDGLYSTMRADKYNFPYPVKTLEQHMKIESSEQRLHNITKRQLETAANILIYLHTCPGRLGLDSDKGVEKWFKTWYLFYQDLFKTKSPTQIILTLNRMAQKDQSFKINQHLLERAETLLNLKFKDNQILLTGRGTNYFKKNGVINMYNFQGKGKI